MGTLLYEYAVNEEGNLTHIDNARKGHCYKCIECGETLIIKDSLKKKKRKHFAHKSNSNCDNESYVHKIWKRRIKDLFYSTTPFIIKYVVCPLCKEVNNCPIKKKLPNLKCNQPFVQEIDLKQEYDTCEEEINYNGFDGDLVLTNSRDPEKEPLFIEIAYSHPCDEDKINSGIKIIEIKVDDDREEPISFEELKNLSKYDDCNLSMGKGNPYRKMNHLPPVRFYNFNRLPYPSIGLYSFNHNDNGQCGMHYSKGYTCKSMPDDNNDATWGVAISEDIINSRGNDYYIEAIMALAAKNNYLVRDCRLCYNKMSQEIFHKKCPAMTEKGFASAQRCRDYFVRTFDVQRMSDRLKGIPYSIRIPKQQ